MAHPLTQDARRNEWKFLVASMCDRAVRDQIKQFLQRDPHAATSSTGRYGVRSLYFDTPFYDSYHARVAGHPLRTRLRLRRYEVVGAVPSDWFLEIKGKTDDVCLKTGRVVLPDAVVQDHLRRFGSISVKRLIGRDSALAGHLSELWSSPLEPTLLVLYDREPFIDPRRPDFRVTFDTHVRTLPTRDPYARMNPTRRVVDWTVMETKFIERMPLWLHSVIETFRLERVGLSKYCLGLDARLSASPDFLASPPPDVIPVRSLQLFNGLRAAFGMPIEVLTER